MPEASDNLALRLDNPAASPEREYALKPYVSARQHDWVRTVVTVGLLGTFGGIIFWACRQSVSSASQWSQTKEMLQIMLPAVTGLLGSVIGFYFGAGSLAKGEKGNEG